MAKNKNSEVSKKKYIGPIYKKGHVLGNKTYNPATMTDEEINEFCLLVPEAKTWWTDDGSVAEVYDT